RPPRVVLDRHAWRVRHRFLVEFSHLENLRGGRFEDQRAFVLQYGLVILHQRRKLRFRSEQVVPLSPPSVIRRDELRVGVERHTKGSLCRRNRIGGGRSDGDRSRRRGGRSRRGGLWGRSRGTTSGGRLRPRKWLRHLRLQSRPD